MALKSRAFKLLNGEEELGVGPNLRFPESEDSVITVVLLEGKNTSAQDLHPRYGVPEAPSPFANHAMNIKAIN